MFIIDNYLSLKKKKNKTPPCHQQGSRPNAGGPIYFYVDFGEDFVMNMRIVACVSLAKNVYYSNALVSF